MTDTKKIALSLYLHDPKNRSDFEWGLKIINNYLASLNPSLTPKQKLELLK